VARQPSNALDSERSEGEESLTFISPVDLRNIALFIIAYFVSYSYGLAFRQESSAPLWLPDSVLLCALLVHPPKKWWLYIVAAAPIRFLAVLHPHVPSWFITATFTNDVCKAMLGAYLLRYIKKKSGYFAGIKKFAAYIGIAVVLLPMLSACFGASARWALGYPFWRAYWQWFLGNALTNLVITPTLLLWCSGAYRTQRWRAREALLGSACFAVCLYYTVLLIRSNDLPIFLFTPVPFLFWAAARFGAIGASTALSFMALALMQGISLGSGPLPTHSPGQNVQFVQLFLGITSLPIMSVAILFEEWQTVEQRLRQSRSELNENYDRIRDLAGRLIQAQEDERKRIARELHDDISQQISLLILELDELSTARDSDTQAGLLELKHSALELQETVRKLSYQLHSSTLRYLGIAKGLAGLCEMIAQQHHVEITLEASKLEEVSDEVSLCMFRVVQEALNNAIRHGAAKKIAVSLVQSDRTLRLKISDSGIGFNPAVASAGLGLISMRERLHMVGGSLKVTSSPNHGTSVEAVVEWKRGSSMSNFAADD
jgi:two-component system sensor histidine kinase UhpB